MIKIEMISKFNLNIKKNSFILKYKTLRETEYFLSKEH